MKTTLEMVHDWLSSHGYDGLTTEDCGCGLDDLAPCGEMGQDCVAARKRSVTPSERSRHGLSVDWMMVPAAEVKQDE